MGSANVVAGLDPDAFEHTICVMRDIPGQPKQVFRREPTIISVRHSHPNRQPVFALRDIIRERADIVHSRNWPAVEAVFAARLAGAIAVHSEHGLDVETYRREPFRRLCLRRAAFEAAHRLVAVSKHLAEVHANRTRVSADRFTVIRNGVDVVRFAPNRKTRDLVRAELGITTDTFCIGCVGTLTPVKDHRTLLRAMETVDRHVRSWRLLLVGDGPEMPNLRKLVSSNGWDAKVSFIGLTNRVAELLNAMDAHVLSSLTEGISNSLLEAMAAGLPVVASAVGGNPELIDASCGRLFPAGDAGTLADHLVQLEKEKELRLIWVAERSTKPGPSTRSNACCGRTLSCTRAYGRLQT